jgi:hypothetical protein
MRLSVPQEALFDDSTFLVSGKEEKEIEQYLSDPDAALPKDLLSKSTPFLLELAKIFKNENRIHEAFYIVENLLRRADDEGELYALKNYNHLMHFKAILLSTESLHRFEEAANIYRKLYYAHRYHIYEPEVVTLYASNLKRMSLFEKSSGYTRLRNKPDTELLRKAMRLYRDSMVLRAPHTRYQDSINIAYLCRILQANGDSGECAKEIREFYKEFTSRHKDMANANENERWWLYATKAEFEALLGECGGKYCKADCFENVKSWEDLRKNYVEVVGGFGSMETTLQDFWKKNAKNPPKPFERDATLRQVKLYLHFTNKEDNTYKCMRALKKILELTG